MKFNSSGLLFHSGLPYFTITPGRTLTRRFARRSARMKKEYKLIYPWERTYKPRQPHNVDKVFMEAYHANNSNEKVARQHAYAYLHKLEQALQ